nr:long-chain-fatty-acid--CoA ligase [Govania unica]
MQDHPLMVTNFLAHGARYHGTGEIMTVTVAEGIHRYTYADCDRRARLLASALTRYGIQPGDRVGTLAWNGYRHLESWFGISGMSAVTHTINPRLFHDQLSYIINHAEDRMILADLTFIPLLEKLLPELPTVEAVVILTDRAHMPQTSLPNVICYEDFLLTGDSNYVWPVFDERMAAGLCYTSGTTGNPKGVLSSHRSASLHTFAMAMPDVFNLKSTDVVLPVVPMFHANAWGVPYLMPAIGAKLVFPGPNLTGEAIQKLIEDENVTVSAGVPTVWLGLLQYLDATGKGLGRMHATVIGGAAAPRSMIETFRERYNVHVCHAWGMTEMSPLGTCNSPTRETLALSAEEQTVIACKQGRAVPGVDLRIIGEDGRELPWDGKSSGHLQVRGSWIAKAYFRGEGGDILTADGWFDTGDVANMDQYGFVQITDRAKDIIKSGGEWISSIDLENAAVAHPKIVEAAVIGLPHPKWTERPMLILVPLAGETVTREDMLAFLETRVAKWWLPDDVVFVDEIPHTATGKILKTVLREQFKDHKLPEMC